jgi:lysophospholipase
MDLVATALNAIPSGARCGELIARDGLKLRYALWRSTATRALGTVCLFGGRTEFIEKYFETVTDLRRRGFAVATMDWRGQGESGRMLASRLKGHVEDFSHYDDDLRKFMTEIVLPDCPAPYYGMAHSMGGHILLRSAQTKVCWYDRIILSAPMIALAPEQDAIPMARLVSEAACLIGLSDLFIPGAGRIEWAQPPFEKNVVTSDRKRYERTLDILLAAPYLETRAPTIGWVAAAYRSMAELDTLAFTGGIKVPVLIVAAGNDQIVSTPAIEIFASRLKNCTRIVIAGARHEILQERDDIRDQFWAAFDAYIPGAALNVAESGLGL